MGVMVDDKAKTPPEVFRAALAHGAVVSAANSIFESGKASTLAQTTELARALAEACGDEDSARVLRAELVGYNESDQEIPPERKALGFASPFPVRALDLGLLDPEEIFL